MQFVKFVPGPSRSHSDRSLINKIKMSVNNQMVMQTDITMSTVRWERHSVMFANSKVSVGLYSALS